MTYYSDNFFIKNMLPFSENNKDFISVSQKDYTLEAYSARYLSNTKFSLKKIFLKSLSNKNKIKFLNFLCNIKFNNFQKNNYSDLDSLYLFCSTKMAHTFGITLSAEFMGANCQISQLTTIGSSGKNLSYKHGSINSRPMLGFCVKTNPCSIISGPISIGSFSQIAAGAVVTKDVPPFSIVKGINDIRGFEENHIIYCINQLWHSLINLRQDELGYCNYQNMYFRSKKYADFQKKIKLFFQENKEQSYIVDFFKEFWELKYKE